MKKNTVAMAALALILPLAMVLGSCATGPKAIADKNAAFHATNQADHDAVDAKYTHKYLEAGGVCWHYVEAGNPDGPVVPMLHGLPESWYSWSKVLPLLDPAYHYILPDMKGYGRSTSADMDYTWHHVGDQTMTLLDALGIQRAYIVGHDWGALISSVVVVDHPSRFLGYVRMEADLSYTPGQSLDRLYEQKPQWKVFQDTRKATEFLRDAQKVIDTVYQPRMKSKFQKADRNYFAFEFSRPGVAEAIANYFKYENWDLEAAVAKVANNHFPFPVLQLQADSDRSQPVENFADASKFPGVKLQWITNASHFDNLDQSKQVADAISRFLAASSAGKQLSNKETIMDKYTILLGSLALACLFSALCASTQGNTARSLAEVNPKPPLPSFVEIDPSVPILTTPAGVKFVRTPDERFRNLKDFPYEAHYLEVDGLRLAYEDEGPRDGQVILMLHGQPDWSYLYRKMIPPLAAAGYRCIALDLMGFGRSDKPVDGSIHTYEQQVAWVKAFIKGLGIHDINLFCQDWGGLIGLRIVGDEPELFARVIAANTYLPVFEKGKNPYRLPASVAVDPKATSLAKPLGPYMILGKVPMFNAWIKFCLTSPTFMPSELMKQSIRGLSDEEALAYDAPFPSYIYKAAPRTFPSMIVAVDDNNAAAWASLGRFAKPFLTIGGNRDNLLGKKENQDSLIAHIPGAKGQKHARYDAGHFIQDDLGPELAQVTMDFIRPNP